MYAEDVERIVNFEHALETRYAPQANHTSRRADHESARDADVTRCGCNRDQTRNSAGSSTEHRGLTFEQPLGQGPRQHGAGRREEGVHEREYGGITGFKCRACVKTKPSEPQQRGTDHGHRQAVWRQRFFAEADALAKKIGGDETGHTRVDMHHGASGEIERTHLPEIPSLGVQSIDQFRIGVRIRAHPEPNHVRHRHVGKREPQHHEQQYCREFHAFRHGTQDQAAGDRGKRALERGKQHFRNHHPFAEGGGHGKFTFGQVGNAFQKESISAAKERVTLGECKAVPVDDPEHRYQREGDKHLHQHG